MQSNGRYLTTAQAQWADKWFIKGIVSIDFPWKAQFQDMRGGSFHGASVRAAWKGQGESQTRLSVIRQWSGQKPHCDGAQRTQLQVLSGWYQSVISVIRYFDEGGSSFPGARDGSEIQSCNDNLISGIDAQSY